MDVREVVPSDEWCEHGREVWTVAVLTDVQLEVREAARIDDTVECLLQVGRPVVRHNENRSVGQRRPWSRLACSHCWGGVIEVNVHLWRCTDWLGGVTIVNVHLWRCTDWLGGVTIAARRVRRGVGGVDCGSDRASDRVGLHTAHHRMSVWTETLRLCRLQVEGDASQPDEYHYDEEHHYAVSAGQLGACSTERGGRWREGGRHTRIK